MKLKLTILNQTRKLNEIKAIKTISVTVIVVFVCYLPGMVYGIMERMDANSAIRDSWFMFIAYYFLFLPGLLNPFIYVIRTRRFRRALKCFLKEPVGISDMLQSTTKQSHKASSNQPKHPSNKQPNKHPTRIQAYPSTQTALVKQPTSIQTTKQGIQVSKQPTNQTK